ncbi:glycosyltransferase [Psychrobacter immobilis]|uniref:glycosyltransferase n=1 Tax=Psychrobacter immobilis TaxID=498 RepID=UPI0019185538|nr:glycosyltransferase [Psychrobacter immobilis]
MNILAPIILFTYNRPWHTRQTVEALQKNTLAEQSDLIIYSDAPRDQSAIDLVNEVREYIKDIKGFKSIKIVERSENWGLAKSIINGVTEVIEEYGTVIVLEDDIVTSPAYLSFMNQALNYYKDNKKVWHISGWSYPIENICEADVYFWRVMNCWGWATWQDKWQYFQKDTDSLIDNFSKKMIKDFDLDNSGIFWSQVLDNKQGKIDTWAIYWYATIFLNQGLCLNPTESYVRNIGLDGSGENCGVELRYSTHRLNTLKTPVFIDNQIENNVAVEYIIKYYQSMKMPLNLRVVNKITKLIKHLSGFR